MTPRITFSAFSKKPWLLAADLLAVGEGVMIVPDRE